MGYIRNEIIEAAKLTNAPISELSLEERLEIRKQIFLKYVQNKPTWIWEGLTDELSVQNPDAWRWVSNFVRNTEVLMLFNEQDESTIFKFDNGSQIVPVLAECSVFEFYLTNATIEYLICFNHHNYLIVVGTAVDWLKRRIGHTNEQAP
jgi:uncharacterized protein DUF6756